MAKMGVYKNRLDDTVRLPIKNLFEVAYRESEFSKLANDPEQSRRVLRESRPLLDSKLNSDVRALYQPLIERSRRNLRPPFEGQTNKLVFDIGDRYTELNVFFAAIDSGTVSSELKSKSIQDWRRFLTDRAGDQTVISRSYKEMLDHLNTEIQKRP